MTRQGSVNDVSGNRTGRGCRGDVVLADERGRVQLMYVRGELDLATADGLTERVMRPSAAAPEFC